MFEKPTSHAGARGNRFDKSAAFTAALESMDREAIAGGVGGPLRAIEWGELTARLLAARDLRHILRRDTARTIEGSAHDFADAAARYFRKKEEGQSNLNPVALEHRKGSPGISEEQMGLNETGSRSPELLEKGPQVGPSEGDSRDD